MTPNMTPRIPLEYVVDTSTYHRQRVVSVSVLNYGHAVADEVSHRLLTSEGWARSRSCPTGICGG